MVNARCLYMGTRMLFSSSRTADHLANQSLRCFHCLLAAITGNMKDDRGMTALRGCVCLSTVSYSILLLYHHAAPCLKYAKWSNMPQTVSLVWTIRCRKELNNLKSNTFLLLHLFASQLIRLVPCNVLY